MTFAGFEYKYFCLQLNVYQTSVTHGTCIPYIVA